MSNTDTPESTPTPKDARVVECLATEPAQWSPALMDIFVNRLEYALCQERKGKLVDVRDQLDELLQYAFANAPDAVRAAITNDEGDPAIRMAFLLGNMSFAHQLASTTAHRRPDDAFFAAFDEPSTQKVTSYLLTGSHTREEIASATGLATDVLSVKMRELTGLGIVDFRHRFPPGALAGVPEYFMTPAAKQLTENPH